MGPRFQSFAASREDDALGSPTVRAVCGELLPSRAFFFQKPSTCCLFFILRRSVFLASVSIYDHSYFEHARRFAGAARCLSARASAGFKFRNRARGRSTTGRRTNVSRLSALAIFARSASLRQYGLAARSSRRRRVSRTVLEECPRLHSILHSTPRRGKIRCLLYALMEGHSINRRFASRCSGGNA